MSFSPFLYSYFLNNFILFESPHKYGSTYCNLSKFHTGHKEKNYKNARRKLENKRGHFLMLKVGKRINTMDYRDLLIRELQKHYVNINYDKIIVCGGGDAWIREIANSFGNRLGT